MKKIIIFGSLTIISLIGLAKIVEANSAPPFFINWAFDWIAVVSAFAIGTSMEIALGYFFLHDKEDWLKALIVANIVSYPIFIWIISMSGRFHDFFNYFLSDEHLFPGVIIIGELLVIFFEALVVKKILKDGISFAKSLAVVTMLNLFSWIVGGQLVIFLFSEKFPYQYYEMIGYLL